MERRPKLQPLDVSGMHGFSDEALAPAESRRTCLDLHENNLLHGAVAQPIEYDQIDQSPEEAHVFGVETEARKVRDDVLGYFPNRDRLASLNRVLSQCAFMARRTLTTRRSQSSTTPSR